MIRTAKSPRDVIDDKMAEGGGCAFGFGSMEEILAESGHRLDRDGRMDLVRQLVDADLPYYLPAISGALGDLADDSGEFADLVAGIAARTSNDEAEQPFLSSLVDVGSLGPGPAVRLARRLIGQGCARHAAHLLGGAMRGAPEECGGVVDALAASDDDEEAAAGMHSLRIAWKKHRTAGVAARIKELAPAADRRGGAPAGEAMGALMDLYPGAGEGAGAMIEAMARRHAGCRRQLAARIGLPRTFDGATALRYLALCAEEDPDQQTVDHVYTALADLAKNDPAAAARIVADLAFRGGCLDINAAHALRKIGRAFPGALTMAVLGRAAAGYDPRYDPVLTLMAGQIAEHADPAPILDVLLGALSGGGAPARPALCMLKAMVAPDRDKPRGAGQAPLILCGLLQYARKRGIDVAPATKEPSAHLKCTAVIRRILHPPPTIDPDRVLENLENLPCLKAAFGVEWFRKGAEGEGRTPHPLVALLSAQSPGAIERPSAAQPRGEPAVRAAAGPGSRSGWAPPGCSRSLTRHLRRLNPTESTQEGTRKR